MNPARPTLHIPSCVKLALSPTTAVYQRANKPNSKLNLYKTNAHRNIHEAPETDTGVASSKHIKKLITKKTYISMKTTQVEFSHSIFMLALHLTS